MSVLSDAWALAHSVVVRFTELDVGATALLLVLSVVQVWLLTERWRAWERTAGIRWPRLRAMDTMGSSLLLAMSLGPFAGDLARGHGPEGIRVRGVVADRLSNTALTLAIVVATYGPRLLGVCIAIAVATALLIRYRINGVIALVTTLIVFSTLAIQMVVAASAIGAGLPLATLLYGFPALLLASLLPLSFFGFSGKEAGIPLVYASLSPDAAVALASLLAAAALFGPGIWLLGRLTVHGVFRSLRQVRTA